MAIRIRSDNKWKQFKYRHEVPASVLARQFAHLDEDDDGFILYRGHWYHTSDFMRIPPGSDFKGWDGYASDSYFSGVLIKLARDGEEYMIGTYM